EEFAGWYAEAARRAAVAGGLPSPELLDSFAEVVDAFVAVDYGRPRPEGDAVSVDATLAFRVAAPSALLKNGLVVDFLPPADPSLSVRPPRVQLARRPGPDDPDGRSVWTAAVTMTRAAKPSTAAPAGGAVAQAAAAAASAGVSVPPVAGAPAAPVYRLDRGLLLRWTIAGRSLHHRVTFPDPSPFDLEPISVVVSADPKAGANPAAGVVLRPLPTPTELFVFLRNRTDKPRAVTVAVTPALVAAPPVVAPPAVAPPAVAAPGIDLSPVKVTLPPNALTPISFGKDAPTGDLPALTGPVTIEVRGADPTDLGLLLATRSIQPGIADPTTYVDALGASFIPSAGVTPPAGSTVPAAATNRWSLTLRSKLPPTDPPCVASLVFPRDRIPSLAAVPSGTLRATLPPGVATTLFAAGLNLLPVADRDGFVHVAVDTVERALIFRTTFAPSGDPTTPDLVDAPAVRLQAPKYAVPNAPLTIGCAVDGAPPSATLAVELGRVQNGRFIAERSLDFPTGRSHRLGFSARGPNGGLLFQAAIRDWTPTLDPGGLLGERRLRARLTNGATVLASDETTVVFDDLAPEKPAFIDPPAVVGRGTVAVFSAAAFDRGSPLSAALFFVGKPVQNKIPDGTPTVPGKPTGDGKSVWTASVPIPATASGPTDVTVQFTNAAGLTAFAGAVVQVTNDPPPKVGRIRGMVREGALPQAGVEVVL
ncbi:MAG: hypothetical protein ACRC1K_10225, partial [Planctomycetia bacterium]